jgi:hypothetical protein
MSFTGYKKAFSKIDKKKRLWACGGKGCYATSGDHLNSAYEGKKIRSDLRDNKFLEVTDINLGKRHRCSNFLKYNVYHYEILRK